MLTLMDREAPVRRRAASGLLAGAVAALVMSTPPAVAADGSPRGNYRDARITGKYTTPPLGRRSRMSFRDGVVKVRRRTITQAFEDETVEVFIRLELVERLEETDRQLVEVASGEFFLRDQRTGTLLAGGGEANRATFKITRRDENEWRIKHKKKLSITEIDGRVLTLTKVKMRADKLD